MVTPAWMPTPSGLFQSLETTEYGVCAATQSRALGGFIDACLEDT